MRLVKIRIIVGKMKMHNYMTVLYTLWTLGVAKAGEMLGVRFEMEKEIVRGMEEKEVVILIESEIILEHQATMKHIMKFKDEWIRNITIKLTEDNCRMEKIGIIEEECENSTIEHRILERQRRIVKKSRRQRRNYEESVKEFEKMMWKYESIRISKIGKSSMEVYNATIERMKIANINEECQHDMEGKEYVEILEEEKNKLANITIRLHNQGDERKRDRKNSVEIGEIDLQRVERMIETMNEGLEIIRNIIEGVENMENLIQEGRLMNPGEWKKLSKILGEEFMTGIGKGNERYPWNSYGEMEKVVKIERDTTYCKRLGLMKIPSYKMKNVGKMINIKTDLFMVVGVDVALHVNQREKRVLEYDGKLYAMSGIGEMMKIGTKDVYEEDISKREIQNAACYWKLKEGQVIEALMTCELEAYFMEELIIESGKTRKPYYYNQYGETLPIECGGAVTNKTLNKQGRIKLEGSCKMNIDRDMEYRVSCDEMEECGTINEIDEGVYNIERNVEEMVRGTSEQRSEWIQIIEEKLEGKEQEQIGNCRINVENEEGCKGYKIWNEAEKIWRITQLIREVLRRTPSGMPTAWEYVPEYVRRVTYTVIGAVIAFLGIFMFMVTIELAKHSGGANFDRRMRKYQEKMIRNGLKEIENNSKLCKGCIELEECAEDVKKYYKRQDIPPWTDKNTC